MNLCITAFVPPESNGFTPCSLFFIRFASLPLDGCGGRVDLKLFLRHSFFSFLFFLFIKPFTGTFYGSRSLEASGTLFPLKLWRNKGFFAFLTTKIIGLIGTKESMSSGVGVHLRLTNRILYPVCAGYRHFISFLHHLNNIVSMRH